MSHGQASVECGFSVEIANLNEDNFVAKRLMLKVLTVFQCWMGMDWNG